jgi:hypothetical protein
MVVPRVDAVPTASEKDFGPGAEIHRIGINRNADVAEIAGAIPRRNVHAPTERDGEMREVAAYTNAFVHGIARAAGWTRIGITEPDLCVHESQIAARAGGPRTSSRNSTRRNQRACRCRNTCFGVGTAVHHREDRLSGSYLRRAAFLLVGPSHE